MILMAVDHVRDFFGNPGVNPTDIATTTVSLFFTRWITHFCAPVFFLLTGTGAYLSLSRKSKRELSRFLFTRGLWLIFLELVPQRCLGLQFNFDYGAAEHFTSLECEVADSRFVNKYCRFVLEVLRAGPTRVLYTHQPPAPKAW
jgi:hypothetical protein